MNFPKVGARYTGKCPGLGRDYTRATIDPGAAGRHELGGSYIFRRGKQPMIRSFGSGSYAGVGGPCLPGRRVDAVDRDQLVVVVPGLLDSARKPYHSTDHALILLSRNWSCGATDSRCKGVSKIAPAPWFILADSAVFLPNLPHSSCENQHKHAS